MNEFIPVSQPEIGELEKRYVNEALDSGWISSDGPFVEKFESEFASRVNRKYGIAVANGSVALELAVQALGIGKNDEVILPTFTIISCLNAILKVGAKPIFIDAYQDTWNMNIDLIESKITKKTKAIMVVHIYGLPTEMKKVEILAEKYNLLIIEDSAEAHGQQYFGKPCGSFGVVSTFSFYANKHITTGEGGMVVTDNEEIANRCKSLRNLCFQPEKRFVHAELGSNYRFTNLQAALGLAQLEKLEQTILRKQQIGKIYDEIFVDKANIRTPIKQKDGYVNHYWVYGIVLKDISAELMMKRLAELNIGTRPFFYPLHKQPLLTKYGISQSESLIVSENLASHGFYLPSGVGTSDNQVIQAGEALLALL